MVTNWSPYFLLFQGKNCRNYIEKHFSILNKKLTKDGPVSASPGQLKEISNLYLNKNIEDLSKLSNK